ncbi:MAG: hypothetical protein QOC55_1679 [Thermoleophilaceae bacterium]|jgi:hypothetical protein|nr:hypothetical protein [Thermoleophilaceae bacterium]
MDKQAQPDFPRRTWAATWLLVAALTGMAYCHIKDVGMKFDEHVYYMAYLFSANIGASFALAAFAVACRLFGSPAWLRRTAVATVGLALSTIAGFIWSRTAGFPQMADHIGQWDLLGITSLVFEAIAAVIATGLLVAMSPSASRSRTNARRSARVALGAGLTLAAITTAVAIHAATASADGAMVDMHYGNMAEYPDLSHASARNLRLARVLHRRTNAYSSRFDTVAEVKRLRYHVNRAERALVGCPGLVHFRKRGLHGLLDPRAPQSLVFWCDPRGRFTLVAFMYRAPLAPLPPTYGGLLGWHRHGMNGTWMTHVWITRRVRESLATCAPFDALHSSRGIAYESYISDAPGIDTPCSGTSMGPMG